MKTKVQKILLAAEFIENYGHTMPGIEAFTKDGVSGLIPVLDMMVTVYILDRLVEMGIIAQGPMRAAPKARESSSKLLADGWDITAPNIKGCLATILKKSEEELSRDHSMLIDVIGKFIEEGDEAIETIIVKSKLIDDAMGEGSSNLN
jgi:hypothetical protein